MKFLEQLTIQGRSLLRRVAPMGRPASLAFRVDGFDAPREAIAHLRPADWTGRLVDLVHQFGALPVRVIGHAENPMLAEVARVAWRLECPVTVRTGSERLDDGVAAALVDAGPRRIELVAGEGLEPALRTLVAVRSDRGARLEILVEVPRGRSLREVGGAARAAGADGVSLGIPWRGAVEVGEARGWHASFHRTPAEVTAIAGRYDGAGAGAPRSGGHCGVGRQRWELGPDGQLFACPFQVGSVPFDGATPDLRAHLAAIKACDRVCVHADLR